jgi:formylglycine-generating enzyme required for sulfatase activity
VSGFRLDKYLVTVGRFRQFVNAFNAGYRPPAGSGKHTHLNGGQGLVGAGGNVGLAHEPGWLAADDVNIAMNANLTSCQPHVTTWTPSPADNENLPINCVTWWEAYAFCIWDGGFLPSEAEWEYAAAGGSQQREYPWGSIAPGTANQYAIYDCYYPSGSADAAINNCNGTANIAPVGTATLGAGRWGQLDLAGDAWQWTLDWYSHNYIDPCADCAYLAATSSRVCRGAPFSDITSYLLPTSRSNGHPPSYHFDNVPVGLRCARTP